MVAAHPDELIAHWRSPLTGPRGRGGRTSARLRQHVDRERLGSLLATLADAARERGAQPALAS